MPDTRTIQDYAESVLATRRQYGAHGKPESAVADQAVISLIDAILPHHGAIRVADRTLVVYDNGTSINSGRYDDDDPTDRACVERQPYVTVNTECFKIGDTYGTDHGMPKISIHLNDSIVYDDQGDGDFINPKHGRVLTMFEQLVGELGALGIDVSTILDAPKAREVATKFVNLANLIDGGGTIVVRDI